MSTDTPSIQHGLGRIPSPPDPRDALHPMSAHLVTSPVTRRTWTGGYGLPLDQGDTPQCVGYSSKGLLLAHPVVNAGEHPTAAEIYRGAQLNDEFPDTPPADGSSVRGAFKFLQKQGYIGEYVWAQSAAELAQFVLTKGPAILGINWYLGMFYPDARNVIHVVPQDQLMGGHAILVIGVNMATQHFRLCNSWGRAWGDHGRCWLSFADTDMLLGLDGEAGAPVEIKHV